MDYLFSVICWLLFLTSLLNVELIVFGCLLTLKEIVCAQTLHLALLVERRRVQTFVSRRLLLVFVPHYSLELLI